MSIKKGLGAKWIPYLLFGIGIWVFLDLVCVEYALRIVSQQKSQVYDEYLQFSRGFLVANSSIFPEMATWEPVNNLLPVQKDSDKPRKGSHSKSPQCNDKHSQFFCYKGKIRMWLRYLGYPAAHGFCTNHRQREDHVLLSRDIKSYPLSAMCKLCYVASGKFSHLRMGLLMPASQRWRTSLHSSSKNLALCPVHRPVLGAQSHHSFQLKGAATQTWMTGCF